MLLINLGQAAVEIVAQQFRYPLRQTVVLAIADGAAVGIAHAAQQIHLIERLERQRLHHVERHRGFFAGEQRGARRAALLLAEAVEVGVLRRIQPQPFRRDEPAAAIGAVDGAGGLQLRQALANGNAGGGEDGAQLALRRQLVARLQRAAGDARLKLILDLQVMGHIALMFFHFISLWHRPDIPARAYYT